MMMPELANRSPDKPAVERRDLSSRPLTVKINPGEYRVTRSANEVIMTVLGSCVAACIRDPVAGVGGMNHFMLPESVCGSWDDGPGSLRYGNFAMERLLDDIFRCGRRRDRLEVKVFGGADMVGSVVPIGTRNADFVEAYLRKKEIPIVAADLRGEHARRVRYFPLTGRVFVQEMPRESPGVGPAGAGCSMAGNAYQQPDRLSGMRGRDAGQGADCR